jgi:ribosome-associated protein
MKESLARDLSTRTSAPLLSPSETAYEIMTACGEANGKDITVLDVAGIFDLSDYFVVVSARSDRQVQGIANRIMESLGTHGLEPVTLEGMEQGHWVLMDWGDVVVHIFYEPVRRHYDVESLWMRARKVDLKKKRNGVVATPVKEAAIHSA